MTIEQKAQRYDEAIERAKAINNGKDVDVEAGTTTCEYIFPELKESEDERIRKALIRFHKSTIDIDEIKGEQIIAWLEKQVITQESDWNEEDEHRVKDIIYFLDTAKKHYASTAELDSCIDWLKSLKERTTWKPSEEQMKALNYVVNLMASSKSPTENELYYNILKSLREQLKKLKG